MNHLSESELIECHYGESPRQSECRLHIEGCEICAAAYNALSLDLARLSLELELGETPSRGAEYAEGVWQSLRPELVPYEGKKQNWLQRSVKSWASLISRPTRRVALALTAAAVVLAIAAFYSGRLWEQKRAPAVAKDTGNSQAKQQVVLLVLSDHLDRSERLLVELNHPEEAVVDPALQMNARQLLDENRDYLLRSADGSLADSPGSAAQTGTDETGANQIGTSQIETTQGAAAVSPAVTLTLDDLERVLSQVADSPNGLSRAEIARVQKEINNSGLLFEVRILRSRVQSKENGVAKATDGGTA